MDGEVDPNSTASFGDQAGEKSAIGSSPDHSRLLECAKEDQEIDTEDLRDFLWRIRAPRSLRRLPHIAERIGRILEEASHTWRIELADFGLAKWPAVIKYIVGKRKRLEKEIGPEFDRKVLRSDEKVGNVLTDWEPYPAYFYNRELADGKYLLLQAHLLFAYAGDVQLHTFREDYEKCTAHHFDLKTRDPCDAGRAVRYLSKSDKGVLEFVNDLPVEKPPFTFARIFKRVKVPQQGDIWRAHDALRRYLERVYDLQVRSSAGGVGSGGSAIVAGHVSIDEEHWIAADLDSDPDDQFANDDQYLSIAKSVLKPAEMRRFAQYDLCPAEFEDDTETIEVRFKEIEREDPSTARGRENATKSSSSAKDATKGPTFTPGEKATMDPSGFASIIGGSVSHIEMANQLLWFAYDVPNTEEIARVFHAFFSAVRQRARPWKPRDDDLLMVESMVLAVTMIATGAPLDKACGLRICLPGHKSVECDLLLMLADDDRRAWWRLRACLPEYETQQKTDKDMRSFVDLPDLVHCAMLVRILLRERLQQANYSCAYLFDRPIAKYSAALKGMLLRTDSASRRITIAKLPKFLFAHMASQAGGDVADTCLASLRWHHLARVPTYYATPKHKRLQELYVATANRVGKEVRSAIRDLCRSGNKKKHQSPLTLEERSGTNGPRARLTDPKTRIGNRRCPTREDVSKAMEKIRKKILKLADRESRADRIKFHNLYTLYTLEFFAASVGVRAVTTPYLHLSEVDAKTGFAVLSEKTVRPAWLPPEMVKQMKYYDGYLQSQQLVQPLPQFRDQPPAACFLIDRFNGAALEITPTVKTEYLREYFDFAPNIFRRFIRNELRESKCPAPVAKAWLSHAARGEEIHHLYAHFSLGAYRQALHHYLSPILVEVGFRPLDLKRWKIS